jgi:hypothetical protein
LAELTIKIEASELAHAILELAAVLSLAVTTEAGKFELAGRFSQPVATTTVTATTPQDAPPEKTTPATDSVQSENVPTDVELRAKAKEKSGTEAGKSAVKALLAEFNSQAITKVPTEKRAEFMSRLEAL